MFIKHIFSIRVISALMALSIAFSSAGIGSVQAQTIKPSIQNQSDKLEATLDESVKLDAFRAADPFIVHFNVAMDSQSSPNPLLSYPYLEGSSAWDTEKDTLTFSPNNSLQPGETYTFFIDPALKSTDGRLFESSPQWTVQVLGGTQVLSVFPVPGLLSTRKPTFSVTFDRPMNHNSAEKSFSIQPTVPFQLSWKDSRTLYIKFNELLKYGQQYTLLVAGGSAENAAMDENGTPLAEDYSWSYGLEAFSANVLPGTSPNTVQIIFSQDLNTTETGFPFTITPPLIGKWRWQGSKTAMFTADEPLPFGQVFSLDIAGKLINKEGEVPLDETSFQFAAPPPIASFLPSTESDIRIVPIGFSPLQIEFTTEVDKKSAEKAFSISPELSGRFEWSKGKNSSFENVLSFYPGNVMQYDTQYTVKLDTGLSSAKGNNLLLEPYSWSFWTTYNYFYGSYDGATFGLGTKVQVVDANGSRRIQFGAEEDHTITFEAYAYDLIDFAALYSDYIHGNGIPSPNAAEKEPVATWNYAQVNPNYQETVIPADVPPGLYILNLLYGGRSYDRLFVALTENTIVTKQSGEDLFVWVTNFNGQNVPEAEIRLYSDRGEKTREGKTDENGLYRVSIPDGYVPMLVSARTGKNNKDVTITGLDYDWEEYANGYWSRWSDPYKYLTYIYTDRPIYRPGQTVNFKAIVSRDKDMKYEIPEVGTEVTVNVRDAKNNILQTGKYDTNEFGSVSGTFSIAAEAALGDYEVETVIGGESTSQTFKVQDYRKPDYKVTVSPADEGQSNKYVNNDKFNLTIDTEYFFGEPVPNAKLTYKLYWLYPNYYWWWNSSPEEATYSWYVSQTNPGISTRTTDVNGQANISYTALFTDDYYFTDYDYWGSSLRYRTYALEVTADDGSNQPVSSAYIFNVYNAEQKVTLDTQGYFKQANQPFIVNINTQTLNGEPMPERELTLEIMSWDSSSYDFRETSERHAVKTDQDGVAKQELELTAGYYQLVLRGQDARGNLLEYERWIRVLASGQPWNIRYWDPITISADQDEYKPYQTARFAIESNINGPALLTFERGSVIHSKIITLTAPLTVVETEIIPEDAPNVFVTVNAWDSNTAPTNAEYEYYRINISDRRLLMATTELKVSAEAKQLQVDISTDKQVYAPGEEVTVNIDVKDSTGKPALAEVSLAMVDEAIFSLSQELAPNIFTTFYGPRDWSVATFSSMSPTRVILDGGGRGGGGGGLESGSQPRSDFQDTAAWFPALQTDTSGRATVTFTLPDNVTSWRLSAKAITLRHLVGQSHANIETKKDLLLRPILPRILTTGDQAQITTMVHNYSNAEQNVHVTLNAPGLKINGDATQSVEVKSQEVLAVGWVVIPEVLTETEVTIVAVTDDNLNDAISLPLPIQPLATKDVESLSGRFNGAITIPVPLPPDILQEVSTVTLKISRTPASSILDGLDYLTGYPYGCVEQTMSRAMPNAVLGRASAQLGIGGEDFQARTKPLIEASIQKLLGLQHNDGGWGWWYDDHSDAYQTAWVLHGLSNILDAGYFIDPQVLQNGSDYLKNQLEEMDIRTRAYALYSMALAGHGNLDRAMGLMDTSLTQLDPFSQAALALTLYQLDEKARAEVVLSQLEKSVIQRGDLAYWPQATDDGTYHRKTMSSTIRTTAMSLSAFMKIRGTSALADSAANYLVNQRNGYGWGTTNETSFTILALTDYLAGKQEYSGSSDFTIDLNGQGFTTGTLQTGNLFASINIPIAQLESGLNSLKLSTSGIDPLYYDIVTSYTSQKAATEAAGNIIVTRRYIDPKTDKLLETITEGQLVKVELKITMLDNASFVILEDHLPGGLEALNESLNSSTQDTIFYDDEYYEERFFWQDYGYNYKEIRGDRVSFFITEMGKGIKVFKYYARATMSGDFTALPAEAYAMYDEAVWGRSASNRMTISPK